MPKILNGPTLPRRAWVMARSIRHRRALLPLPRDATLRDSTHGSEARFPTDTEPSAEGSESTVPHPNAGMCRILSLTCSWPSPVVLAQIALVIEALGLMVSLLTLGLVAVEHVVVVVVLDLLEVGIELGVAGIS